jgi:hypothetical protein
MQKDLDRQGNAAACAARGILEQQQSEQSALRQQEQEQCNES